MSNVKVAFICVHNSCRSQIAEAFGRHLASDVFQSYSAGTETKPQINQDAVRIMKELYNIDMEADGQFSKLVSDIPNPDIRKLQDKAKTSYTLSTRRLRFGYEQQFSRSTPGACFGVVREEFTAYT